MDHLATSHSKESGRRSGQKTRRWVRQCGRRHGLGLLLLSGFVGLMVLRCLQEDLGGEADAGTGERRLNEGQITSSYSYVQGVFSQDALNNGACILHLIGTFYMFLALAIVCDEFFVPSLEQISDSLHLRPDVAGATFMAAGGSAPEFFTSLIDYNMPSGPGEVGLGTIMGSAVFNVLFVIGVCALVSPITLSLSMWPLARDATFYIVDLIFLTIFFSDGEIVWYESLTMLILYFCYCIFMRYNEIAEDYFTNELLPRLSTASRLPTVLRVNVAPAKKGETDVVPSSDRSVSVAPSLRHHSQETDSGSLRRHSATDMPTNASSLDSTSYPSDVSNSLGSTSSLTIGCEDHATVANQYVSFRDQPDSAGDKKLARDDPSSSFPVPTREGKTHVIGEDPSWKERTEHFGDRAIIRRVQSLPVDETNHGKHASAWAESDPADVKDGTWRAKARLYGSRKSVSGGGIISLQSWNVSRHVNGLEVNTQSALRARIMTQMYRTGPRRSTLVSIEGSSKALFAGYMNTAEQTPKVSGTGEAPEEMSTGSRTLGQVREEETDEEERGLEIRCPTSEEGFMAWVKFFITLPLIVILAYTIPDVRRPERQQQFILSFFLSLFWISFFTYLMLAWATTFASTLGVSEKILGLTFLAVGTSIPDLITSFIVSKQGHGDMAVSSSIGSNIFDVTVALPVAWLIYHAVKWGKHAVTRIPIRTKNVGIQAAMLMFMVVVMVVSIKVCNWKMSRKLGLLFLVAYVIFLVASIWIEISTE